MAVINISYKKNKQKVKVLNSKLVQSFLKILIQNGIVWGYYIYSKKYLILTLKKCTKYTLGFKFKVYMLTKNAHYISSKNLFRLVQKNTNSTFYLSTSQGFLTDKEALKLSLGGKLICKIT